MTAPVSFLTSLALAPVVMVVLCHLQTLDQPSARSSHVVPTIRGGGLAPAVAAIGTLVYANGVKGDPLVALLLATTLYAILGLADDLRGVAPLPRLTAQLAIALAVLPWLLVDLNGSAIWYLVVAAGVLLWLPAYVNAFNFMDGINGISVAQAVVAGTTWWAIAQWEGAVVLAEGSLVVAFAALGFLPFNFPRARMFLGDIGSYFLGAWLAVLAVVGLRAGISFEAMLAPLALYLADTGATLARRVRRGETWYEAHCDHTYQHLHHALGWSHCYVTTVVTFFIVGCSALGAVSETSSMAARVAADVLLVAVLATYVNLARILAYRRGKVREHEKSRRHIGQEATATGTLHLAETEMVSSLIDAGVKFLEPGRKHQKGLT